MNLDIFSALKVLLSSSGTIFLYENVNMGTLSLLLLLNTIITHTTHSKHYSHLIFIAKYLQYNNYSLNFIIILSHNK